MDLVHTSCCLTAETDAWAQGGSTEWSSSSTESACSLWTGRRWVSASGRSTDLAAILSLMRLIFSWKKFANLVASAAIEDGAAGSFRSPGLISSNRMANVFCFPSRIMLFSQKDLLPRWWGDGLGLCAGGISPGQSFSNEARSIGGGCAQLWCPVSFIPHTSPNRALHLVMTGMCLPSVSLTALT